MKYLIKISKLEIVTVVLTVGKILLIMYILLFVWKL